VCNWLMIATDFINTVAQRSQPTAKSSSTGRPGQDAAACRKPGAGDNMMPLVIRIDSRLYFVCDSAPKIAVVNSPGFTFSELDITTTPLRCIGYKTILVFAFS
jgi:hypothetical protein